MGVRRLGITQFLINHGIARLEEVRSADGTLENIYVRVRKTSSEPSNSELSAFHQVDREAVLTRGRDVAGKLLVELQVRKSTADGAGARKFYTELTDPLPGWDGEIRDIVLKKKLVSNLTRCNLSLTRTCCSRAKSSCNPTHLLLVTK